jgi:deoxyadenosine/deoxycytidine kinase
MKYNYIAIEGNIGAGKTSLAKLISEQFNAKLVLEEFADNPFLPKFYENPSKYAFALELSFVAERYRQLTEQLSKQDLFKSFTISDYFINKSLIFAQKTLEKDEFTLFSKLFNIIYTSIPKPDLFVFLYVETDRLLSNINRRGRTYEQNIQKEYLEKIQSGYLDFIKQQPQLRILVLDINKLDFVNHHDDYKLIVSTINQDYPTGLTHISLK